jgi:hypothetical protein
MSSNLSRLNLQMTCAYSVGGQRQLSIYFGSTILLSCVGIMSIIDSIYSYIVHHLENHSSWKCNTLVLSHYIALW